MAKLQIQPMEWDFDNYVKYANDNNLYFELLEFSHSPYLDDKHIYSENINKFVNFESKNILNSMHSAFNSLDIASWDDKISTISKERIITNCEAAGKIEIKNLVVHSLFNSMIRNESYTNNWIEKNYIFYSEILNKFDINIFIENCIDFDPSHIKQLIDKIKSSKFKTCLDIAHVNCASKVHLKEWFEVLGNDIGYFHYSDNDKSRDAHLPLGEGNIDFALVTKYAKKLNLDVPITLEVFSIAEIDKSINYLKENNFYPFCDYNSLCL